MQKKTIQKVIIEKLEDWLSTIDDHKLRCDVKSNIVLSGGSIASMMLNEPVNDYDVYIKEAKVAERLAKFYVDKCAAGIEVWNGNDSFPPTQSTDEDNLSKRAVSSRNLKPGQIKLYMASEAGYAPLKPSGASDLFNPTTYYPIFFSPNAISLSHDIQIVLRFTGDAKTIHESYDFIHATNYFTFEDGIVTNLAAVESLFSKQLKYQGSKYPLTSVIRSKKFVKRGWNINAGDYLKMCFQISELDLTDINVLEEQLIGVDVAYFGKLIEVLRPLADKPYFSLTSEYLNTIIDRVFGE